MTWKLAFRNLFRNKRRTFATGAAVLSGFIGLTLLGGYIIRIERGLRANSVYLQHKGHISIFKNEGLQRYRTRPSRYQITESDYRKLLKTLKPHEGKIEWIGQSLSGAGLISNGTKSVPFIASGVDLKTLERSYHHPDVQKWAQDFLIPESRDFVEAIQKDPLAISVTKRLAALIQRPPPFSQYGNTEDLYVQLAGMTLYGDLNAVDATLAVIHSTGSELTEDSGLLAPLELLQQLYMADGYQYVMLYLKDDSQMDGLVEQLENEFQKQGLPFEAFPFDHPQISPNYVGSMGFLYAMAGFFVFLICGAVILSVVNSLTMGILERTREIGTFRAIGYQSSHISWMMAQESLCLGFLGSGVGILLALVIAVVVNSLNIRFSPPGVSTSIQFILTPQPVLVLMVFLLFMVLVGVTSYFVTQMKLKMKIIDLLSDAGA